VCHIITVHHENIRNLKSRYNNNITEENKNEKQAKESEKLLCPKACVLKQLDDDRLK
jgi:hypothetical protein